MAHDTGVEKSGRFERELLGEVGTDQHALHLGRGSRGGEVGSDLLEARQQRPLGIAVAVVQPIGMARDLGVQRRPLERQGTLDDAGAAWLGVRERFGRLTGREGAQRRTHRVRFKAQVGKTHGHRAAPSFRTGDALGRCAHCAAVPEPLQSVWHSSSEPMRR